MYDVKRSSGCHCCPHRLTGRQAPLKGRALLVRFVGVVKTKRYAKSIKGESNHETKYTCLRGYIAARLALRQSYSSIYDYSQRRYISVDGSVSLSEVNVYDYELKCYISGNGDGKRFDLYHYGDKKHIELNIDSGSFSGYDYASGKHFDVNINGNSISIYDYEFSKYFDFSV